LPQKNINTLRVVVVLLHLLYGSSILGHWDCRNTSVSVILPFIMTMRFLSLFSMGVLSISNGFVLQPSTVVPTQLFGATGGWGIGQSREISEGEYARGERRAFDGFEITEQGEFMRQVKRQRLEMIEEEKNELLEVARMAGIEVKDPSTRLNKFGNDVLAEEDEDLDLRVTWEEEGEGNVFDLSVTRLDEDTGAMDSW
jgi:hypothetical protein